MNGKKWIFLIIVFFASCSDLDFIETPINLENTDDCRTITDSQGNEYKLIRFGSQCWMAENLKLECSNGESWDLTNTLCEGCADKASRLYNWNAAICACDSLGEGWRLPSDPDWLKLEDEEFDFTNSELLKYDDDTRGAEAGDAGNWLTDPLGFNTVVTGWYVPITINTPECDPDNSIEFSNGDGCLQHYGCYQNGSVDSCNHYITYYWTSTKAFNDNNKGISRRITPNFGINRIPILKSNGLYVRCVKY
jgi:uncharacterized protein (TIGR02145 family)